MLRSFTFANHKSFKTEQTLDMLPVYDKERGGTFVTGVFGANASGKTALVDAFAFTRQAVLESYRTWPPEGGVPRSPFKLDPAVSVSSFAVDLELAGERYVYEFSLDDERVHSELLHHYPKGKRRTILKRDGRRIALGATVRDHKSRTVLLRESTRDNALALATAAQLNQDEVMPVYRWFQNALRVRRKTIGPWPSLERSDFAVARHFKRHPELATLIKAADLGISGVRVVEERLSDTDFEPDLVNLLLQADSVTSVDLDRLLTRRNVHFFHAGSNVPLTANEESDGTLAWIDFMATVLDVHATGGVMVVDELDASLHPRLTAHLIEAFQDREWNRLGAQLIFTSHDTTLLGPVFGSDNLRRDEVWFVEKASDGSSRLYPLTDFRPRKEDNVERRYLTGSYGAVARTDWHDIRDAMMRAARGSAGEATYQD